MAKLRNTIYYEFYSVDRDPSLGPITTGTEVLGETSIETGIDTVPTMTLTIPLQNLPAEELNNMEAGLYTEPRLQRYLMRVYINIGGVNKYTFHGTIDTVNVDSANYAVQLGLSHQIARMREWPMPVNYTVKNAPLSHVVGENGGALGYANPPVDDGNFTMQSYERTVEFAFEDGVERTTVDMTFGSNNKLGALQELIEKTVDVHFYVDLEDTEGDRIVFGKFGRETNIVASPHPYKEDDCEGVEHDNYVTMLTEPQFNVDYTDHYNRAIVFCGDIQNGVLHLTLEGMMDSPDLIEGFPVGMYEYGLNLQPETEYDTNGKKINNEKVYADLDIVAYSKNTNREYFITDTKQLEEDAGVVLTTTYKFDDLYPIPTLQKDINNDGSVEELVITDDDRREIVKRAYEVGVRKLMAQRAQRTYQFNASAFPKGCHDGDKITLTYTKSVTEADIDCDNDTTQRRIINVNAPLYLTKRSIVFDEVLNEKTVVTLDNELRRRAISAVEVELRQKLSEGSDSAYDPDYASSYNDSRKWRDSTTNPEYFNF